MHKDSITICPGCGTPFVPHNWPRPNKFCHPECYYEFRRSIPLADRFWPRVLKTDNCWIWQGPISSNGYGWLRFRNGQEMKYISAHCVSWILHNGPIPKDLFVCHSCDKDYPIGDTSYRRCVHPDHLFLGTSKENSQDAAQKGRLVALGSKLLPDQVKAIREAFISGSITKTGLAHKYGVDKRTIWQIVTGRTWQNI